MSKKKVYFYLLFVIHHILWCIVVVKFYPHKVFEMSKQLFYFLVLMLIGCSAKKSIDINDFEKKQTFIKILGFIKTYQVDSIREYYPYQYENDSIGFLYTMANIDLLMNASNSIISQDSIFIKDSSFVLSEKVYFHKYYLRFYKDRVCLGGVGMDFYDTLSKLVSVIQNDFNVIPVDTAGFTEIMKKMSKNTNIPFYR